MSILNYVAGSVGIALALWFVYEASRDPDLMWNALYVVLASPLLVLLLPFLIVLVFAVFVNARKAAKALP